MRVYGVGMESGGGQKDNEVDNSCMSRACVAHAIPRRKYVTRSERGRHSIRTT